jgi:hypothetical protein
MRANPSIPQPIESARTQLAESLKNNFFQCLAPVSRSLEPLPQKHRSILYNPLAQFGTFSAANPQIRIAHKVKPSDFRNRQSEHLGANPTLQANISRSRRTPAGVHFAWQAAGHFQFCADSMSA